MKRVVPFFLAIMVCTLMSFGCRESDRPASEEVLQENQIFHNGKMMSREEVHDLQIKEIEIHQAMLAAQAREYERLRNLSPFENALEPAGWRNVTRAFVLSLPDDGEASVVESLAGRLPTDAAEYASGRDSGLYLAGSLSPRGGYTIDSHDEERFCLEFDSDGTFLEGQGLASRLQLKDVKGRLAKLVSNPKQAYPWPSSAPPPDP